MKAAEETITLFQMDALIRYTLFVASLVSVLSIYRIISNPLKTVPGPFWAKFTEFWRTARYYRGSWHDDIIKLHEKYGPVVRIAPNEVSIVDKEALLKVYGHATGIRKTRWYDVWRPAGLGEGMFYTTLPKEHAFLRKRVSNAYSMSTILSLEHTMQPLLDNVWAKFRDIANEGRTIDMQQWANYLAYDVVTRLGVGEASGFVQAGADLRSIIKTLHTMFLLQSVMGYIPGGMRWFQYAIPRLFLPAIAGYSGDPNLAFGAWMGEEVVPKVIARTQAGKTTTEDHLDRFIAMKEADGSPASLPSVLGEAGNLLGAGGDTTAIGIAVVLGELLQHPEYLEKVRAEVDGAFEQTGQALDYRTAEKLPFLHASVKEALRLCPSILWQLPREAPAEGITIAGHYIPPDASVSMSPIAMNRCKEIFGDDANEFRPDRYFRDPEYVRDIEKFDVTVSPPLLSVFFSRVC